MKILAIVNNQVSVLDARSDFKKILECSSPVTTMIRCVGDKCFTFWISENQQGNTFSAMCRNFEEVIIGNIIIAKNNGHSLTQKDIDLIKEHIVINPCDKIVIYKNKIELNAKKGTAILLYEKNTDLFIY